LAFQSSGSLFVAGGPSPGSSIPPASGLIYSAGATWRATAGQESASKVKDTGACPVSPPPFVTQCQLSNFSNAGFSITASAPASSAASGSRTGSLGQRAMRGVSLTIDCALTTLCATPSNGSKPGAPTNVGAVAGDSSATVSWTPPASTGG